MTTFWNIKDSKENYVELSISRNEFRNHSFVSFTQFVNKRDKTFIDSLVGE